MKLRTLEKIFVLHLKDIYSSEHQIIEALPKMVKATDNMELRFVLKAQIEQAQLHLACIEDIFKNIFDEDPWGENCNAMEEFIEEIEDFLEEDSDSDLMSIELIAICQKIGHYEIASYETVLSYAQILKKENEILLLQKCLDDELSTNVELGKLSKKIVKNLSLVGSQ